MVVNAGFLCDAAAEHAHRRHRLSFAVLRLGTSGTAFACVFSLPIAARTPLTTPPFACASPRKPPAWSLRCKYRLSSSMMALITSDLAAAAAGDALRHRGGYDFLGGNGHTAFAPRSHRLCFMCSQCLQGSAFAKRHRPSLRLSSCKNTAVAPCLHCEGTALCGPRQCLRPVCSHCPPRLKTAPLPRGPGQPAAPKR